VSAVIKLAWKSLMNRKATAVLTIMTVAISVILLLGVERIRTQAKDSFANTISGTDNSASIARLIGQFPFRSETLTKAFE